MMMQETGSSSNNKGRIRRNPGGTVCLVYVGATAIVSSRSVVEARRFNHHPLDLPTTTSWDRFRGGGGGGSSSQSNCNERGSIVDGGATEVSCQGKESSRSLLDSSSSSSLPVPGSTVRGGSGGSYDDDDDDYGLGNISDDNDSYHDVVRNPPSFADDEEGEDAESPIVSSPYLYAFEEEVHQIVSSYLSEVRQTFRNLKKETLERRGLQGELTDEMSGPGEGIDDAGVVPALDGSVTDEDNNYDDDDDDEMVVPVTGSSMDELPTEKIDIFSHIDDGNDSAPDFVVGDTDEEDDQVLGRLGTGREQKVIGLDGQVSSLGNTESDNETDDNAVGMNKNRRRGSANGGASFPQAIEDPNGQTPADVQVGENNKTGVVEQRNEESSQQPAVVGDSPSTTGPKETGTHGKKRKKRRSKRRRNKGDSMYADEGQHTKDKEAQSFVSSETVVTYNTRPLRTLAKGLLRSIVTTIAIGLAYYLWLVVQGLANALYK